MNAGQLRCKYVHSENTLRLVHRQDPEFLAKYGRRKVFHVGSNSSCHQHIRSHYAQYCEHCAERKIPENHYTVPRQVEKARQGVKNALERGQMSLDTILQKTSKVQGFSKEGVLKAVVEFVVCDDQVRRQITRQASLLIAI